MSVARQKAIMTLLHIIWEDSHHRSGWTDEREPAKPMVIHSIGWLVSETDTAITLSANVEHTESQWCCEMTIPKRCVIARHELDQRLLNGAPGRI
jgi:hypothetical protein